MCEQHGGATFSVSVSRDGP